MERITKFRHNIMSIPDIHTFESIMGEINNDCKDVYFVRAIGTNVAYLADIQEMDDSLLSYMSHGRAYYQRLNALPKMQNTEDINFYAKCYADWMESGKKEMLTRVTAKNKVLAEMLSNACIKVEELFKQDNKQVTDSIIKNFIVKLVFWYDFVFSDDRFHFDEKLMMKIVASNIIKKQEYLFFYMVTLMGCDVLLLQSKADITEEEEKLELSSKFVLGEFSDVMVPIYQQNIVEKEQSQETDIQDGTVPHMQTQTFTVSDTQNEDSQGNVQPATSAVQGVSQGNPQVTIPPHPGRSQGNVQPATSAEQGAGQGNPRVTIPPHPGRSQGNVQLATSAVQGAGQGNPRVTIPPHPGRSQGNVQPTTSAEQGAGQGNPRVTIPPHPGRSQSNVQPATSAVQGAGQGNPQVTIPPHPGRSQSSEQVTVPPGSSGSGRPVNISTPARPSAPVTTSSEAEKSFEELAMLASSVVLITVYDEKGERLGSGSGIMIGKEGYILTNNHVAAGGRCFSVRIEDDDKEYRTDEIIKYHSVLDLAIIRIQRKLNPIPVYKGSKPLVRGQKVVAIGSPLGLFNSVSDGIISGFRKIDEVDMIQFTAPTSRGSSGGAVLNMQGEVIGISTAGIDAGQNINLAMGYECINMFIRGFI